MNRPPWTFSLFDKRTALTLCAAGLLLFAVLSYSAIRGKSATYDETTHSVAGFVHAKLGDFRINPEDPALFGYWGSLIQSSDDLKIVKDYAAWDGMLTDFATNQWIFSILTLYQTPGNDGDAFLQRSRFMFTLLGVALGGLIAAWAWRLAGPAAGVLACGFFCFDPNFAAHGSLFKNDVMLSLMLLGLGFALWNFGRRGTVWNLAAIALAAAAAINVKFSGVLCGPIILVTLGMRALLPGNWSILSFELRHRWRRLLAVAVVCLVVAVTCDLFTWACYGFRYPVSTAPGAVLNVGQVVERARASKTWAEMGEGHTAQEALVAAVGKPVPIVARALVWAMDHRLLPQSWLFGFLFTYATTQIRSSYLLGQIHITGFWYYFPCCFLFKTPTATLGSIVALPIALLIWRKAGSAESGPLSPVRGGEGQAEGDDAASTPGRLGFEATRPPHPNPLPRVRGRGDQRSQSKTGTTLFAPATTIHAAWPFVCLAIPVAIYLGSAMTTNLNLGLRHLLPIYPFLFVALGCGLAILLRHHRRLGVMVASLLLGGLAVESLAAYPNYLAFFNLPSGGARGGLTKLGDSNLDWGQDLKALAAWQREHNTLPMYLSYFGTASPAFYGVKAANVPSAMGGWTFEPDPQVPQSPCYLAISATNLQGIYLQDTGVMTAYAQMRSTPPLAVVGGSIYVYQLPLTEVQGSR